MKSSIVLLISANIEKQKKLVTLLNELIGKSSGNQSLQSRMSDFEAQPQLHYVTLH